MGGMEATLLQTYAGRERHTSVLVAAMSASATRRPALTEPASASAIALWLEATARAAQAHGGRVVRRVGNEMVALFATPDAGAAAAARIHYEAERLLPGGDFVVRTGLHNGPVRQRGHDVLGDTVNLAAALAARAAPGQLLTSQATAGSLGAQFRHAVRPLPHAADDALPVLGELDWHQIPPECLESLADAASPSLRLTYRYNTLVRRREGDSLTIGRDPDCDVCIDIRLASRRHCTLERRGENFLLRDHSTNGTFVSTAGGREVRIRTEEMVLHGRGWLSFGVSRLLAEELVQFLCE